LLAGAKSLRAGSACGGQFPRRVANYANVIIDRLTADADGNF
jgi:hypothetical protein